MNRGAELLLSRMDSHPEEFDGAESWDSRWSDAMFPIIRRAQRLLARQAGEDIVSPSIEEVPFLTDDEVLTVYEKYALMQDKQFTNKIMQKLLEGENPSDGAVLGAKSHPISMRASLRASLPNPTKK